MTTVPKDILGSIFGGLCFNDKFCCYNVCKTWRQLLYNPEIWSSVDFTIPDNFNDNIFRNFLPQMGCLVDTLTLTPKLLLGPGVSNLMEHCCCCTKIVVESADNITELPGEVATNNLTLLIQKFDKLKWIEINITTEVSHWINLVVTHHPKIDFFCARTQILAYHLQRTVEGMRYMTKIYLKVFLADGCGLDQKIQAIYSLLNLYRKLGDTENYNLTLQRINEDNTLKIPALLAKEAIWPKKFVRRMRMQI